MNFCNDAILNFYNEKMFTRAKSQDHRNNAVFKINNTKAAFPSVEKGPPKLVAASYIFPFLASITKRPETRGFSLTGTDS